MAERPVTAGRQADEYEFTPDGKPKKWLVVFDDIYKTFFYTSKDDAITSIENTFKNTFGAANARQWAKLYATKFNEQRLLRFYFNDNGFAWYDRGQDDIQWNEREPYQQPSQPKHSDFTFVGRWIQGDRQMSKTLVMTANNWEDAKRAAEVAMRRILRARRLPEHAFQLDYRGASRSW